MSILRNAFDQNIVDQEHANFLQEQADAQGMGALRRGWNAGRVGGDLNAARIDEAAALAAGDAQKAALLGQQREHLEQRQALYAPEVAKVEDIRGLGDALSWAGTQMGQGAASMADPVALSAAGAALGKLPGVFKLAPVAAGIGSFALNQRQMAGEHVGRLREDPTAMANLGAQGVYDQANMVGLAGGALDTAPQFMIVRALGGAALRKGASGMMGRSFGGKMATGMLGEGATEVGQGEIGRYVHGLANAERKTSGDWSDRLNEFAGGAVGGAPFSAAGAAADMAYGGTAQAGEVVKDKAGTVIDMTAEKTKQVYEDSGIKGAVDLGVEGTKSVYEKVAEFGAKVKDYARNTEGHIDWAHAAEKAERDWQVYKLDDAFAEALDPENPDYFEDAGYARRTELVFPKLNELRKSGDNYAQELMQQIVDGDPVGKMNAVDAASDYLAEKNAGVRRARLSAIRKAAAGEAIQKVASKMTHMVKAAADAAAFVGANAAVGVAGAMGPEKGKKNKQSTNLAMLDFDTWKSWRDSSSKGVWGPHTQAKLQQDKAMRGAATHLGKQATDDRQIAAQAQYDEVTEEFRRNFSTTIADTLGAFLATNPPESAQGGEVDQEHINDMRFMGRTIGFEIGLLAATRPTVDPKMSNPNRATAQAYEFERHSLAVLDAIADDLRTLAPNNYNEALQAMMDAAPPEQQPFFAALGERLAAPPRSRRMQNEQLEMELLGYLEPAHRDELMATRGGPAGLRETITTIVRGQATPTKRAQLEKVLGAKNVRAMMEFVAGTLPAPRSEQMLDDMADGNMIADTDRLSVNDDGEINPDAEVSDFDVRQAERKFEKNVAPPVFGFTGEGAQTMTAPGPNRRGYRNPFANKKSGNRPPLARLTGDAEADASTSDKLDKRVAALEKQLGVARTPEAYFERALKELQDTFAPVSSSVDRANPARADNEHALAGAASRSRQARKGLRAVESMRLDQLIDGDISRLGMERRNERNADAVKDAVRDFKYIQGQQDVAEGVATHSVAERAQARRQYDKVLELKKRYQAGDPKAIEMATKAAESFFGTRAGGWDVQKVSAWEVMEDLNLNQGQRVAIFADYMKQEAKRAEDPQAAAKFNNLARLAQSALADISEGTVNEAMRKNSAVNSTHYPNGMPKAELKGLTVREAMEKALEWAQRDAAKWRMLAAEETTKNNHQGGKTPHLRNRAKEHEAWIKYYRRTLDSASEAYLDMPVATRVDDIFAIATSGTEFKKSGEVLHDMRDNMPRLSRGNVELLNTAMQRYFKQGHLVRAQQRSERAELQMTNAELDTLARKGAAAIHGAVGDRSKVDVKEVADDITADVRSQILHFPQKSGRNFLGGRSDEKANAPLAIKTENLVAWVRMNRKSENPGTDSQGWPLSEEASWLRDLNDGISSILSTDVVSGMPYMVNKFGKKEFFNGTNVPDVLALPYRAGWQRNKTAEKKNAPSSQWAQMTPEEKAAERERLGGGRDGAKANEDDDYQEQVSLEALKAENLSDGGGNDAAAIEVGEHERSGMDPYGDIKRKAMGARGAVPVVQAAARKRREESLAEETLNSGNPDAAKRAYELGGGIKAAAERQRQAEAKAARETRGEEEAEGAEGRDAALADQYEMAGRRAYTKELNRQDTQRAAGLRNNRVDAWLTDRDNEKHAIAAARRAALEKGLSPGTPAYHDFVKDLVLQRRTDAIRDSAGVTAEKEDLSARSEQVDAGIGREESRYKPDEAEVRATKIFAYKKIVDITDEEYGYPRGKEMELDFRVTAANIQRRIDAATGYEITKKDAERARAKGVGKYGGMTAIQEAATNRQKTVEGAGGERPFAGGKQYLYPLAHALTVKNVGDLVNSGTLSEPQIDFLIRKQQETARLIVDSTIPAGVQLQLAKVMGGDETVKTFADAKKFLEAMAEKPMAKETTPVVRKDKPMSAAQRQYLEAAAAIDAKAAAPEVAAPAPKPQPKPDGAAAQAPKSPPKPGGAVKAGFKLTPMNLAPEHTSALTQVLELSGRAMKSVGKDGDVRYLEYAAKHVSLGTDIQADQETMREAYREVLNSPAWAESVSKGERSEVLKGMTMPQGSTSGMSHFGGFVLAEIRGVMRATPPGVMTVKRLEDTVREEVTRILSAVGGTGAIPLRKLNLQGTTTDQAPARQLNKRLVGLLAERGIKVEESALDHVPPEMRVSLVNRTLMADLKEPLAEDVAKFISWMTVDSDMYQKIADGIAGTALEKAIFSEVNRDARQSMYTPVRKQREVVRRAVERLLTNGLMKRHAAEAPLPLRVVQMVRSAIKGIMESLGGVKYKDLQGLADQYVDDLLSGKITLERPRKPGTVRVDPYEAFKADQHAADLTFALTDGGGFALTGSLAYASQGSVYRPAGATIHDLDFTTSLTQRAAEQRLERLYPQAHKVRSFGGLGDFVSTYVVPPKGHRVDLAVVENGVVRAFVVRDASGKIVGRYTNNDKGEASTGVKGTVVDLISDKRGAAGKLIAPTTFGDKQIPIADVAHAMAQKLMYARDKDIIDFANFVPNSRGRKLNAQGTAKAGQEKLIDEYINSPAGVDMAFEVNDEYSRAEVREMFESGALADTALGKKWAALNSAPRDTTPTDEELLSGGVEPGGAGAKATNKARAARQKLDALFAAAAEDLGIDPSEVEEAITEGEHQNSWAAEAYRGIVNGLDELELIATFEPDAKAREKLFKALDEVSGRSHAETVIPDNNSNNDVEDIEYRDVAAEDSGLLGAEPPDGGQEPPGDAQEGAKPAARALTVIREGQGTKKARKRAQRTAPTDEDIQAAKDYLRRVLGDQIRTRFGEITGYSGQWIEDENVIEVSTLTLAGALNVARHEALHAFWSKFVQANPQAIKVLSSLTNDPRILRRLEVLLADDPHAIEQLADGEERLAYIYQFAMAGQLKLPHTPGTTLMSKIRKFLRQVFMMVRDDERAVDLLYAFEAGAMRTPDAAAKVIAKALNQGTWARKASRKMDGVVQGAAALVLPANTILANSSSPTARKMAKMFYTNPGEEGSAEDGVGYLNARNQKMRTYNNLFRSAIEELDDLQLKELTEAMQKETPTEEIKDPDVVQAKEKLHQLFARFHKYLTEEKGLRMGEIRENYFPVVYDPDKVRPGLRDLLTSPKYIGEMNKMVDAINRNIAKGNEFLEDQGYYEEHRAEVTLDEVLDGIVNHITRDNPSDDIEMEPKRHDGVLRPWFAGGERRVLFFLDPEDRAQFQEKDITLTMTRYIRQGVRAAEYSSRFGRDGRNLARKVMVGGEMTEIGMLPNIKAELYEESHKMLALGEFKDEKARKKWVERQYRDVARAVGAMEGSLGHDVSELVRNVNAASIVYQNIRLLPLALFSSFVDPLGIVVGGGTMTQAWDTFARGIKGVARQWADMLREQPPERAKDEWEKLAELAGVIDSATFSHLLTDEYGSVYLGSKASKANERMFKANGMEAWNRGMRVGATKAAVAFMERHNKGGDKHSERWLRDLGFGVGELKLDSDGRLITGKRDLMVVNPDMSLDEAEAYIDKVHAAINRWVESTILSPNAAQRPAWGSDPHYGMFWHLKQFAYSFHQTIMKRAINEAGHGNYAPLGVFAWYIPAMIVSDVVKGLALGAGELPAHMKSYNLGDWMMHGVRRAGILGIGDIAIEGAKDPTGLAGPSVEQATDLFFKPLEENLVRALPANALYSRAIL